MNTSDPADLVKAAVAALRGGDPDESLRLFDAAIALAPQDGALWRHKAVLLGALGRLAEEAEAFGRAVALDPGWVDTWNNLGRALSRLRRFDEALAAYDRGLALAPRHTVLLTGRGLALEGLARREEALASYASAISADATFATAWEKKAALLLALGRHEEATDAALGVLARRPQSGLGWMVLGKCALVDLIGGRPIRAPAYLLEQEPEDINGWWGKASVLLVLGRWEAAAAAYDRVLAAGGIAPAIERELWTNRGHALRELGRDEEALASYDRSLALA